MIGYKAVHKDMTGYRGFRFEVGKPYSVGNNQPLKLGTRSGFHFCQKLENVFKYYNWDDCRIFEVETFGEVVSDNSESITKGIKLLKEIDVNDFQFQTLQGKLFATKGNISDSIIFNEYKNSRNINVRETLIKKLTDENKLMYFKNDKNNDVRSLLVYRLTDENKLMYFKDNKNVNIRLAVVEKLTNKNNIMYFKDDKSPQVRLEVAKKIKDDEKLLFETFKNDENEFIRGVVVNNIVNEDDLMYFKNDSDYIVRYLLIDKLIDEKNLIYFKNNNDRMIRESVVKRIKDENLVFDNFKNDDNWLVRLAVIKRLTDKNKLIYFTDDKVLEVREETMEKLSRINRK